MRCWTGLFLIATATAAPALAQTAATPPAGEQDAIVCTLLESCPPERAAPRTSDARGFSFSKGADKARPAGSTSKRRARVAAAAPRTTRPGQYDLNVNFVSGSADVAPDSQQRVRTFATALQDPRLAGRRVLIEGHTDSVGGIAMNIDLSERRARAIADLVTATGIEPARLDVKGYGPNRPIPGTSARNGINRRVVASLVK